MIPTFFTTLALGTITTMVATIMGLSSWVTGSAILQGNLFFDSTNNSTPKIFVDDDETLNLTAGGLGFITNGSQSGVTLKNGTVVAIASRTIDCTGTGGLTGLYDTCRMISPLSTTGAISRISLMVSASPSGTLGIDCGFTKTIKTATGTVFNNLNNIQSATGSIASHIAGSGGVAYRWNPADSIKCGTLGTPTSSFSAKLKVDYFDDTSE